MKKLLFALVLVFFVGCEVAIGKQFSSGRCLYISTNPAEIVVAASDASSEVKRAADYVCDGTADNVEIQAALDKLDGVGGKVTVVAGSYELKSNVEVPSNVILEFMPGNAITVASDHTLDADTTTKNTDTVAYLIRNKDSSNTNIHVIGANVDFGGGPVTSKYDEDKKYLGIWLDTCTWSSVENCSVDNVVYDSSTTHESSGIWLVDCTDSEITRCRASYCGYEGIGLRGNNTRCIIRDCESSNNAVHSFQMCPWAPTYTGNPQDCKFIRCYDKSDNYGDSQIIFHGLQGMSRDAINLQAIGCDAETILIMQNVTNCTVTQCNFGDLLIYPYTGGTLKRINIVDNICTKGSLTAHERIRMANGNACTGAAVSQLNISGNQFYQYSAISFASGESAIVAGDTITNNSETATVERVYVTSGSWVGGDAAGNIVISAASGAFASGDVTVSGTKVCVFAGNVTCPGSILLSAGLSTNSVSLTDVVISNNIFDTSEMDSGIGHYTIKVIAGASNFKNVQILDNTLIHNIRTRGVYIESSLNTGAISNITVSGNNGSSANGGATFLMLLKGSGDADISNVDVCNNYWRNIYGEDFCIVSITSVTDVIFYNNDAPSAATSGTSYFIDTDSGGTFDGIEITNNNIGAVAGLCDGTLTRCILGNNRTPQILTADGAVHTYGSSQLSCASTIVDATLANGDYLGQQKKLFCIDDTEGEANISIATHETSSPEVYYFDDGEWLSLEWDGVQWITKAATAGTASD